MGAVAARTGEPQSGYQRRRPETTALYEIVRDNLETLYGAIDDGALDVRLPKHSRKDLEAFLECGLLCRGFARLYCPSCKHSQLVAFACKGRGFCPSCMGRRMSATAANLIERVLPEVDLRQCVLTFPFAWRRRLAQDGALLGTLTRLFVDTVHDYYTQRAAAHGGGSATAAKTGAATVVQRTSANLRLNPHLHVVFLDGAYSEQEAQLTWQPLGHLQTREVGQVLQRVVQRIDKHLRRHGLFHSADQDAERQDAEDQLAASAVSGQAPPAGPQWRRGLSPLTAATLGYDKPLCAALDGFTLHAATRAGALDPTGREKLLCYVLRPPIAHQRIEQRPHGLVRIALKRAFADGTLAVEMDPLSLLCRLATSVPPPRFHTVKYAGVLAPASKWRARIKPQTQPIAQTAQPHDDNPTPTRRSGYRAWAHLLQRTFELDVRECPKCHDRLKMLALVTEHESAVRYLNKIGEPTEVPGRSKSRGPPYWKSTVLRR